MSKQSQEEYIKELEHKLDVYDAQHNGELEPAREGPICAACSQTTEIRRDSRVCYCVNENCKVGKQNV